MSDFTPSNRVNSEPRRPRRLLPWILLLLLAVAIGAVLWASNRIGYESSPVAVVKPKAELSAAAEIADKTAREAVANLQQMIQELRAEQRRIAEQISGLQRQISAEQGGRKLLSEQLVGFPLAWIASKDRMQQRRPTHRNLPRKGADSDCREAQ
jgi:uncharacterized protein HemX